MHLMATRFKPLFLALVLIGTCWAGTEALSLSDFLIFASAPTNSSLPPTDETPSDHVHYQNHHTPNEDDNQHNIHNPTTTITQPDPDKHHDHAHNHRYYLGHDDADEHHHTERVIPQHPNTDNTGYRNTKFTFRDPLSLSQRRESNQWSSANENPSKPHLYPTTADMNHKQSQKQIHISQPRPSHSAFIMPYPFINHLQNGKKDVHSYSHPRYSPHDSHSYHQNDHYHHAHAHHHPHPYEHTHSYNHHHHDPHHHHEASIYPDFFYDRPSVHLPPPPPPMPTCPMLYTRVANRCIAIFSIARMTWDDARLFCDGIFGELLTFDQVTDFYSMVSFLKDEDLSSSFWVGGRASRTGWYWVGKQRLMDLGTPFWAVRGKFDSQEAFQAPATNITNHDKWCAAMNSRDYYYLSDAKCKEKKSPVCVLRQDAEVVVASGKTNYYPALDNSFEVWNRKSSCQDDDSDNGRDSSEESSEESNDDEDDEEEVEDEDDDNDMDENKGEKKDEGMDGINIESEKEEEMGGKESKKGDKKTEEEGKEGKEEVDNKEVEVEGTIRPEEEDGSGMDGISDDEDMIAGSGDSSDIDGDVGSGMTMHNYNDY